MKEETYRTCLDPALQSLENLLEVPYDLQHLESPMKTMILELRFFKMFFWGLAYWEESEYDWHLRYVISIIVPKLSQIAKEFKADYEHDRRRDQNINWEEFSCDLEKRIQQFKPQVREVCILLLGGTFKCKSCQRNHKLFLEYARDTASFIDFILQNFKAILHSNIDMIAPVKQQIAFIQWKLEKFGRFTYRINHSITRVKKLRELLSYTLICANQVSCLAFLYWIHGKDESGTTAIGTMLLDLLHKTMPYIPGVIASYLEGTMIPQLLASYFDFLLEDLVIPMKDQIEILREGLIFLLSFIVDPPNENLEATELILAQFYAIINELPSLIFSIRFEGIKEDIFEMKFFGILEKIDGVKTKVRELYVKTQHPSQFNSPRTNVIGFLDSFLGNLKEILEEKVNLIPFLKYQVEIVQKELELLKPFLQSDIGLQNEHGEFMNIWTQSVDMVYYAAYITNFCPPRSFSVWYAIVGLPCIIEDIKLIKIEIQKVKDHYMCKTENFIAQMESSIALPPQATTSKITGAFIGFEKDARSIIECLIRGREDLTIISISGMPGQGKTTLAKKIYNDPLVQHYFHKMAWSYVSKECTMRKLLIKIVHDITNINFELILKLKDRDLVERLWKSLRRQRYFIVMDDIWDVDVWRQVQISFPNDSNGSRILLTSRNHDLASQANPYSISHHLRLFSDEESWELMKEKLFHFNDCPLEFLQVGKQIAIYCKGLPLAVSLIAAFLRRVEKKVAFWHQVAENLKSHLASEGCGNIIELSYKYLPDHLKPCFLYFGAFLRGENVRASKLKLLWIAEGFIKDNETNSLKDLANGYLNDLVSQNLVVVTERNSIGGINRCNLHDLLYDLCLDKAMDENFLHWVKGSTVIDQCNSSPQKYNHHRLCIGRCDPMIKARPIVTRKELPTSQVHSLLWSYDSYVHDYSWRPTLECLSCFLEAFKVIVVLDLEGVFLTFVRFPDVILYIIHLRFLALRGYHITRIPSSITNLCNLETLVIRGWRFYALLPVSMWKIKNLIHVNIPLARLNLEDFEENNSFTAYNIDRLGKLILGCDSKTQEFLRKLRRLRKLSCYCKEKDYRWFSMFGSLRKLESLRIEGLGYMKWENLPTFNFPENLKKLTLFRLGLPLSAISIIEKQLPNLQVLKLLARACLGTNWNVKDGDFSKLRFLKLDALDIEHIDVSGCENPFPCLEQLVVDGCKRLEEIPSIFGDICTLNTIKVVSAHKVARSAIRILEEQQHFGNQSLQVIVERGDEEEEEEHENNDHDREEANENMVELQSKNL